MPASVTPRAYHFRYPLLALAAAACFFFSSFLFAMPGSCGGPGLLHLENDFAYTLAYFLLLAGLAGVAVSLVWLVAMAALRTARALFRKLDPAPDLP